jgi:hypothetical protein
MLMMGVPMAGLYVLSIVLVRAFEPKEDGTRTPSLATMLAAALAPVCIIGAVGFWLTRADAAGLTRRSANAAPTPVASPPPGAPLPDSPAGLRIEIEKLKQQNRSLVQENQAFRQRLDAIEAKLK